MRRYTVLKPPSVFNPKWIYWSKNDLGKSIDPEQISFLLFITRKKEIRVIYKPTPVFNDKGELSAITGNMFDKGSTPAFFKINNDEVGSCYAIREHNVVPVEYRPETPLPADLVKETGWKYTANKISLIAIPTLDPLPYSRDIESTTSNAIAKLPRRCKNFKQALFWGKEHGNVIDQVETKNHTVKVFNKIISSAAPSRARDPACAATKGLRTMTFVSSPFIETSLVGKSFEAEQASLKEFLP
jgi:hypothetical protein